MRFVLVLFFILFHNQIFASTRTQSTACQAAQVDFENRFTRLEKLYSRISYKKVLPENKPTWTWGTKKEAVYLLHGFIGTPEEMSGVAKKLIQQNYTVINDIIPGYGSDGFVANEFNQVTWQRHVSANLKSIASCFEKIHLIGFSTGGLLVHHYARTHSDTFTAASITLYSPYYKSHLSFVSFIGTATAFLTPVVSTPALYRLTHFPDIKVAVLKPEHYLQELPLDAANYVQSFGKQVDQQIKNDRSPKMTTPVLLFISDGDQILNQAATLQNVNSDFESLEVVHFKKWNVPHHLMVKEVSPVAEQVQNKTLTFIQKN